MRHNRLSVKTLHGDIKTLRIVTTVTHVTVVTVAFTPLSRHNILTINEISRTVTL